MSNKEIKKQILDKIKRSNSVWIFNGFTEYYFKSTKSDILSIFRKLVKGCDKAYLTSFLNEFNEQVRLNENNELFFN